MSNENAELIRRAYQAYASGDLDGMLALVDPELEWTYLDPALKHPTPQVCHGRQELEQVLRHWAEHGLRAELRRSPAPASWSWSACGRPGSTPTMAGLGMTVPTAYSRCARDGSLPCVTAATGKRPSRLPESGHEPTRTTRLCRGVPGGVWVARRRHHLGAALDRAVDQDPGHCHPDPGGDPPAGLAVTDLGDLGQLQARFNDDQGMPRLVLALAPT